MTRTLIWALAFCLVAMPTSAQSSAGTAAPAPDVHTSSSQVQRMVVVRLKNGTDLLDGLKQAVARERITNAVAGGHVEPGTKVFTFANISIAVLSDSLDLSRNDDWNWH